MDIKSISKIGSISNIKQEHFDSVLFEKGKDAISITATLESGIHILSNYDIEIVWVSDREFYIEPRA